MGPFKSARQIVVDQLFIVWIQPVYMRLHNAKLHLPHLKKGKTNGPHQYAGQDRHVKDT